MKNMAVIFLLAILAYSTAYANEPNTLKSITTGDDSSNDTNLLTLRIRHLLRDKNFEELNRILGDFQESTEQSINNENMLLVAYNAFGTNDTAHADVFSLWAETYPTQYEPYAARAVYEYEKAWFERGNQWSSETSDEQLAKMHKHLSTAVTNAKKALKLNQNAIIPYYILIGASSTRGDDEGALAITRMALELYPASYVIRERYLKTLTPRWGGSYEQMVEFIDKSSVYIEQNSRLELLHGVVFSDIANMKAITEQYSEAEELFARALQFGDNYEIYYKRAVNRKKRKQYKDALEDINRAIELYPYDAMYYYHRSDIYTELDEFLKAVPDIQFAYTLSPNDKYINKHIDWLTRTLISDGYELNKKRQYDLAKNYIDKAVALKKMDANGYYWRSRILIKQNKRDMALNDIKKAVSLDGNEIEYYHTLDWLLSKQHKWDDIIDYWDGFIDRNPDDSRAYVERGGAYFHKGDMESAMRDAKIAADMGDPEGKVAYEKFNHTLTPQGKVTYYVRSILSNEWAIPLFAFVLVISIFIRIIQVVHAKKIAKASA